MGKNKFGGKHKNLARDKDVKKFTFIEPDDENIFYAYVGKPYGHRQFDATILRDKQKVRLNVPLKRKSKRIAEGNLIKISKAECFSKETYCYEGKCDGNEERYVMDSEEYGANYKSIKGSYQVCNVEDTMDGIQFTEEAVFEEEKEKISYADCLGLSEEEELDFDDL